MRDWVNEWRQEGSLWIWRYRNPKHGWDGWHLSADPAGARSLRNLIDRMHGGQPCHRTLRLEPMTDAVLAVPNYKRPIMPDSDRLRVDYTPEAGALSLAAVEKRLVLLIGSSSIRPLAAALAQVEAGYGDFGMAMAKGLGRDRLMFWWSPLAG